jgi:hypothetical protein
MAYFPTFTLSLAVNIGTKYSTPYISASYVWDISQTPIPNHIMATATWDYLGTIPTSNLGYDSAQVTQVSAKSPLARPRPHGNWIWLGIFFLELDAVEQALKDQAIFLIWSLLKLMIFYDFIWLPMGGKCWKPAAIMTQMSCRSPGTPSMEPARRNPHDLRRNRRVPSHARGARDEMLRTKRLWQQVPWWEWLGHSQADVLLKHIKTGIKWN